MTILFRDLHIRFCHGWSGADIKCSLHLALPQAHYSMFPIKRTIFFTCVTVHKDTVPLIGNKE